MTRFSLSNDLRCCTSCSLHPELRDQTWPCEWRTVSSASVGGRSGAGFAADQVADLALTPARGSTLLKHDVS
jgi:hypothetical protein